MRRPTLPRSSTLAVLACLSTLSLAPAALAAEGDGDHAATQGEEHTGDHAADGGDEHGEHSEGHSFVISLLGSYQAGFSHGVVHHLGGGGLAFEAVVVPNWFEIEVSARGMKSAHGVSIPLELLFKIPFHATEEIHPFVGIGPMVSVNRDETLSASFGGLLMGGSYFWVTDGVGFVLEAFYGMADHEGLVHEVGINGGLAFGF